ncbi:hypothetical protein XENTR_v10018631 [Xenopus tropicalis]|uniref:Toll-interleukin 1 receptor (TIR) domain containing adaptor protein n=1 Tax=Xenopus tropicalis TaxID=8364 RepID=A0A6I8QPA1_XENTR|nr:toll/interleukin-1 receptor domain-containing adapter protein isoform X1 [Xenopus tropicalis]KAE8592026.1 hypothetical protein XENTR_v10018631 [Xenopus tropicalis]KAE8592027.1 hypothetical protein XENTR_v10018631 [Xenopus tropicalis]KAE8592028.1 hypothetical protein XENTR_v10018631 [Xenopus tropicalis]KAE8592029.1 hypothetical protein XENTR_v10018631 [Xenopus tropicalis]
MLEWLKQIVRKDQQKTARPPNPVTSSKITSCSGTFSSSHQNYLVPKECSPPPHPNISWPEKCIRWSRLYDAYICHSERDSNYALALLRYLETQPEKLRCFLPMRDMSLGSPIPSEICSGLGNSHCWIMLLTPEFLSDDWCKFQMHQALIESPLSEGRLIPVMINLEMSQYPAELRFMHAIRSWSCDDSVFCKIRNSILSYMTKTLQTTDSKTERQSVSSSNILEDSNKTHMSCSSTLEKKCKADKSSTNIEKSCEALTPDSAMQKRSSDVLEISSNMHKESYKSQESCSYMQKVGPETEILSREINERSYETQEASRQMQAICCEASKFMKERNGEAQKNSGTMQGSWMLQETSMVCESISHKTQILNDNKQNSHEAQKPYSSTQERNCDVQKNHYNIEDGSLKKECSSHNIKAMSCETLKHFSKIKGINIKSDDCGFKTHNMKNETPEEAKKIHKISCDTQEPSRMAQRRSWQVQDSTAIKEEMTYVQNFDANTQDAENFPCINSTNIYTNQEDTQLANCDRYMCEGALALNQRTGSCRFFREDNK